MAKSKYRILRLRSGEDIIGQITGKKAGKLVVFRPMAMKVQTLFNEATSEKKDVVLFRDWLKSATQNTVNIPEDHVATFLTPSADVVTMYEKELEKADCNPSTMNESNYLAKLMQDIQEQKKQQKMLPDPNSVIVSLAIPPAIFLHLVANGMLGQLEELEDLGEPTDEELREIEREEEKESHDPDNPDFGNRFDDWPDEPEDYI